MKYTCFLDLGRYTRWPFSAAKSRVSVFTWHAWYLGWCFLADNLGTDGYIRQGKDGDQITVTHLSALQFVSTAGRY